MNRNKRIFSTAAMLFVISICATAAQAQLRVFVSAAAGNDVNPCSRTAPCRNFQRAHDVAFANGEIIVLDSGGYGTVSITKSITISGEGTTAAITVAAGATGVNVAVAGGTVSLRNLYINGNGSGTNTGINVTAGKVIAQDCKIERVTTGINVTNAKMDIINCDIHHTDTAVNVTGPGTESGGASFTPSVTLVRIRSGNITFNTTGLKSNGRGYNANSQDLFNIWAFASANTPDINLAGNVTNYTCTDGPAPVTNNPCQPQPVVYNWTNTQVQ